jgi:hypothetical protein
VCDERGFTEVYSQLGDGDSWANFFTQSGRYVPPISGTGTQAADLFLLAFFLLRPVLILAARVLPSTPPYSLVYDVCANKEDHYGRSTCSGKEGSENKKAQSGRQEGSADSAAKRGWQKSSPH